MLQLETGGGSEVSSQQGEEYVLSLRERVEQRTDTRHDALTRMWFLQRVGQMVVVTRSKTPDEIIPVGQPGTGQRLGKQTRIGTSRHRDAIECIVNLEYVVEGATHGPTASTSGQHQRAVDVKKDDVRQPGCQSWVRMLVARGPLGEGSSSKLTRCPSASLSNSPAVTPLR